jgi:hypothetical protein
VPIDFPIEMIRTPFGESFNQQNHWLKTLDEYKSGITDYKETSLYTFHQCFQPSSIVDVVDGLTSDEISELRRLYPLGSYPWARWVQPLSTSRWFRSRHCGPTPDVVIEKEFLNFICLYEKIKTEGFNWSGYGYPVGLMLIDDRDSRKRKSYCIMLGGNHRTAVASFMGIGSIGVRLFSRFYIDKQIIKYSDLDQMENEEVVFSKRLFRTLISDDFNPKLR